MKFAHISDVHYSPKHLKWVRTAMRHAVDTAIKEGCDIAVISGDLFDHGMSLHEPAVTACVANVLRLAANMPVILLQGTFSHDRPGSLDIFKEMNSSHPILVADEFGMWALVGGDFEPVTTEARLADAEAIFVCLPSLNKADPEVMEHGAKAYVEGLAQTTRQATQAAKDKDIPTVLVTHGTIQGSVTESKYAMVSTDHEFTADMLYDFGTDAVMIGHIHAHQIWNNDRGQVIAYPGSLARLVHGDHSKKGFLIWDMDGDQDGPKFIETPTRQLIEIDFDGPPVMVDLVGLSATASEDDSVRIRWMVDADHAHTIDKDEIRRLFAHCETLKIEGTVLPIQSVRSPGISRALSIREKLEYWAKTTGDEDVFPELRDRLDTLRLIDDVEEITNRIMEGK